MEEPLTEELLGELLSAPDPTSFIDERHPQARSLSSYLCELLEERGLERKDVVRESQLDSTYGYQIFTGQRTKPSRDKVLQLAFAMHLNLRETDRALQAAGASKLYCKDRRDAIVIFCLDRATTLTEANETLFKLGECALGE